MAQRKSRFGAGVAVSAAAKSAFNPDDDGENNIDDKETLNLNSPKPAAMSQAAPTPSGRWDRQAAASAVSDEPAARGAAAAKPATVSAARAANGGAARARSHSRSRSRSHSRSRSSSRDRRRGGGRPTRLSRHRSDSLGRRSSSATSSSSSSGRSTTSGSLSASSRSRSGGRTRRDGRRGVARSRSRSRSRSVRCTHSFSPPPSSACCTHTPTCCTAAGSCGAPVSRACEAGCQTLKHPAVTRLPAVCTEFIVVHRGVALFVACCQSGAHTRRPTEQGGVNPIAALRGGA